MTGSLDSQVEFYNNFPDGRSNGGQIIFLTSNGNKYCPLVWNSIKVKRPLRFTLAAEAIALNEGCESAIFIPKILELLKIGEIPLLAITDNKSPDEASNSLTARPDLLFQVEIAFINLKWVERIKQIGDCFKKKRLSPACLLDVLKSDRFLNYIHHYKFMDTLLSKHDVIAIICILFTKFKFYQLIKNFKKIFIKLSKIRFKQFSHKQSLHILYKYIIYYTIP